MVQNFSVIFAHARCHLSCQERLWHSVAFSGKRKSVSSKTKPLCQGLPYQGSWRADARLRGWTKDAFRVSGERRCCSVQPLRHLRSRSMPLSPFGTCVPPPPAGGVFPSRGALGKEVSFSMKLIYVYWKTLRNAKASPTRGGGIERQRR